VAYYNKNKWQESFDDLTKVINLDEKFSDAYLYRAYDCEGMQKNQSALYDYVQVQKLNPGSGLAFFKCGLLRSEMNDEAGACRDFKKAASLSYSEAMDYADRCDKPQKKDKKK
jgi:tetratricopeptide (TPR) repeat protein